MSKLQVGEGSGSGEILPIFRKKLVTPGPSGTLPDDVVLGKVVTILDGLTGMKTRRTQVREEGPRSVRWRLTWVPDPERDPEKARGIGKLITEQSFVELVFDRWTGKLDMELAIDGKKAKNVDPHRPIIIGPPGFENLRIIGLIGQVVFTTIPGFNGNDVVAALYKKRRYENIPAE